MRARLWGCSRWGTCWCTLSGSQSRGLRRINVGARRAVPLLFPHLANHVAQFIEDELVHGEEHGLFRAGDRNHDRTLVEPGRGTAHDRRRADVLIAEGVEDLAEPVQPFL